MENLFKGVIAVIVGFVSIPIIFSLLVWKFSARCTEEIADWISK